MLDVKILLNAITLSKRLLVIDQNLKDDLTSTTFYISSARINYQKSNGQSSKETEIIINNNFQLNLNNPNVYLKPSIVLECSQIIDSLSSLLSKGGHIQGSLIDQIDLPWRIDEVSKIKPNETLDDFLNNKKIFEKLKKLKLALNSPGQYRSNELCHKIVNEIIELDYEFAIYSVKDLKSIIANNISDLLVSLCPDKSEVVYSEEKCKFDRTVLKYYNNIAFKTTIKSLTFFLMPTQMTSKRSSDIFKSDNNLEVSILNLSLDYFPSTNKKVDGKSDLNSFEISTNIKFAKDIIIKTSHIEFIRLCLSNYTDQVSLNAEKTQKDPNISTRNETNDQKQSKDMLNKIELVVDLVIEPAKIIINAEPATKIRCNIETPKTKLHTKIEFIQTDESRSTLVSSDILLNFSHLVIFLDNYYGQFTKSIFFIKNIN
ncbi:MAG: hypothetical protein MHPSP_002451 [Paramarteilia canceri]